MKTNAAYSLGTLIKNQLFSDNSIFAICKLNLLFLSWRKTSIYLFNWIYALVWNSGIYIESDMKKIHSCFVKIISYKTILSTLKPWYNKPQYSESCDIVNWTQLPFWGFTRQLLHLIWWIIRYSQQKGSDRLVRYIKVWVYWWKTLFP